MATENYTLGRGEIYFAKFLAGTTIPGGERYFGNTPEFSFAVSSESIDQVSSDDGVLEKEFSVLLRVDRKGSFATDAIRPENIALFFLGSSSISSTTAYESHDFVIAGATVSQGCSYQLGTSMADPAGVGLVSEVTVKNTAYPAIIYGLGTDYTLDAQLGRITVIEGGAIADGTGVTVGYVTEMTDRQLILSGRQQIEGALRYIATNLKGERYSYFMPRVTLVPNGDYALKTDSWQTLSFNFEIMKKSGLEVIYTTSVSVPNLGIPDIRDLCLRIGQFATVDSLVLH